MTLPGYSAAHLELNPYKSCNPAAFAYACTGKCCLLACTVYVLPYAARAQAIDSNGESDIHRLALNGFCLASQLPLRMRDR